MTTTKMRMMVQEKVKIKAESDIRDFTPPDSAFPQNQGELLQLLILQK